MSHPLNNLCLVAALAAWVSVLPITRQSPGAEAQTAQSESGLELQVLDPQGEVCAGAQVEFAKDNEPGSLRLKTDQEGRARIQTAPGVYSLKIKLPGFVDYKKSLTLKPGTRASITATLSVAQTDCPITVDAPLFPVIESETPLLEPVPIPESKPAKPRFWRRLFHFHKQSLSS